MPTNRPVLAAAITALLVLPACEQSNSPDRVSSPEQNQAHDHHDHAGHDHAGHDHEAHDHSQHADHSQPHSAETLEVAGVSIAIPEGWSARPPSNTMRIAELVAPLPADAPAGTEPAVAAFSIAGGPIDMNIDRWKGQFAEPDAERSRGTREINGLTVHLVEMTGTYKGMGLRPEAPDSTMRAAIVERQGQANLFIKMTGPVAAMTPIAADWETLVTSIKSE